jgi:hypothetical protein
MTQNNVVGQSGRVHVSVLDVPFWPTHGHHLGNMPEPSKVSRRYSMEPRESSGSLTSAVRDSREASELVYFMPIAAGLRTMNPRLFGRRGPIAGLSHCSRSLRRWQRTTDSSLPRKTPRTRTKSFAVRIEYRERIWLANICAIPGGKH